MGGNRWSPDARPGRFGGKGQERKREKETFPSIIGEEKGSEGRTPRVSGAERGSRGSGIAQTTERVAKPWGWSFRDARQRVPDTLSSGGSEEKGAPIRNAEGAKSSSEAFLSLRPSSVDQGLGEATAELGGKTLKGGVEVHGRIIRWGYLPGPPVTENPRVRAGADGRTGGAQAIRALGDRGRILRSTREPRKRMLRSR